MKELTREQLERDMHIIVRDGAFYVYKNMEDYKPLRIYTRTTQHKYGKDVTYAYIAPYDYATKKSHIISYHRFLYAWHYGKVPATHDVDHIDGDTMNNNIENLQLLTRKDNLARRQGFKNQYQIKNRLKAMEVYINTLMRENNKLYQDICEKQEKTDKNNC